jgi:hypothetical protein
VAAVILWNYETGAIPLPEVVSTAWVAWRIVMSLPNWIDIGECYRSSISIRPDLTAATASRPHTFFGKIDERRHFGLTPHQVTGKFWMVEARSWPEACPFVG